MNAQLINVLVEFPTFAIPAIAHHAESPRALVVLLPAMGTAAGYYGPFADRLAELGISVLVPELPGTGTSRPRPSWSADYGYRDLVDIYLPAIVTQARQIAGDIPVILVGHSLGAHIATLAVAGDRVSVEGVVSVASGNIHFKNWSGAGAARVLFISRLFPILTYLFGYLPGQYFGFGGPQARTLIREWGRVIYSGSFEHIATTPVSTVDCPSLCIGLEGDSFSPPKSVRGLARMLDSDVKTVPVNWPGNPHSSWARNPLEIVAVIDDWLEEKVWPGV